MVRIVCSSIRHVIQHLFAIQPQPLRNSQQSYRTEGPFRVDVQTLAFATAHINRQLTGDRKRVAYLRLSCPEFSKEFSYGTCLDAAA
jgi:hypothetical protein